jgi:hypothetical protein
MVENMDLRIADYDTKIQNRTSHMKLKFENKIYFFIS